MTHTPTPWFKSNTKCGGYICSSALQVPLAEVFNLHDITHDNQDDDNAEFIILACNVYDELLEALEGMFGLVETLSNLVSDPMEVLRRGGGYEIAQKARIAIAKAKGE